MSPSKVSSIEKTTADRTCWPYFVRNEVLGDPERRKPTITCEKSYNDSQTADLFMMICLYEEMFRESVG